MKSVVLIKFFFQMQKMNVYRMKMKQIRSDMMYIAQRLGKLKEKSFLIQDYKVNQKALKVSQCHFEQNLIATKPKNYKN